MFSILRSVVFRKLSNEGRKSKCAKMLIENQPNILIIGAGAAGIAAAAKLTENGFKNVTILEAENRIGGRLHSVKFEGTVVDLGAQWVHGEKDNTVYQLVKDLNLLSSTSSSNYDNFSFFTSDNSKLDKNLIDRLCDIASDILEDFQLARNHGGTIKDYFKDHYYEKVLSQFINNNQVVMRVAPMLEEWISKFVLCLDPADSWHYLSTKGMDTYKRCDGDLLLNWKDKGYATILDVLMKKIPNELEALPLSNKILTNKEVGTIIWDNNLENPKKVTVNCTDGSSYQADHVIVTVSIAVLRHFNQKVFSPKPPEDKIRAAEQIPLGNIIKVFLKFPKKWWPDDVQDFSFLWTHEDKKKLLKDFQEGPVFEGRSWLEDIFGFYTVDCHPEILLGWYVGPMVKQVELLPDDVLQKGCMFLLKKFVGKYYDVLEPESILRSKWGTNPHFQGTYSYVSVSMKDPYVPRKKVIEPLRVDGKEVVLFAGEATHFNYFSTVHGAIDTGFREADRLIKIYKEPRYHKVVIVGAGMAGLGAASKLVENKVEDFLVLEAENQAGGRIRTILVDNKSLDLGAQWLHGKQNPLYDLAVKHDLLADEMSEEGLGCYVRSNGQIVDPYTVQKTSFKIGKILEECETFSNLVDFPSSMGDFLGQKFKDYTNNLELDNDQTSILKELFDWHVRFQVIDNSCTDLSRLSAKSWGDYICLDDVAHYNLKYGYQSLVEVILEGLPKNCVEYNAEVNKIILNKDKRPQLSLSNNDTIICDHLILTPSLGVLKSFPGLPEVLPDSFMKSIEFMGFAGICKVYLFFEEKWWGDTKGFQLLWTRTCNFSEKHSWIRQVTGFDEVFNHPNALMTWVGGSVVEEVENLPTEVLGKQCTDLLQKFLPNYSVPLPSKVIRTKWLTNPLVKGSYCHITPECDGTNYGIRQLREPVLVDGVPRIILAGEAVHPAHFSTTHGAFESGQEQAEIVSAHIQSSK